MREHMNRNLSRSTARPTSAFASFCMRVAVFAWGSKNGVQAAGTTTARTGDVAMKRRFHAVWSSIA